jgi:hypothetical protein
MQLSYEQNVPEAVLGLCSEDFYRYTDTVIPQVPVKTGTLLTADKTAGRVRNSAKLPSTALEIARPGAMGIVPLDTTRDLTGIALNAADWPTKRPTPVVRKGRIWVLAESAVARWTYPFVRFAASANGTILGGFRGDADGATAAVLNDAIILTDADVGGLFLLEINLF